MRRILCVLVAALLVCGCGRKEVTSILLVEDKKTEASLEKIEEEVFSLENIPEYSGEPFVGINDYVPFFTEEEKKNTESFESYSELDSLGRCGIAFANIGRDILPTEKRGSISEVKPTGWHSYNFEDTVEGGCLYNRCHLIAHCLAGEDANEKNLITGTRYLNIYGMLTFEEQVKAYVEETGNHVLYRATPYFEGDDLLCKGVQLEAWSVEDGGKDICFNVFSYNVQPNVTIDYKTGEAKEDYLNVLCKPQIEQTWVFNSKDEHVGDRAYMKLSEEKFNGASDEELIEFCESIIKDYEDKDYNYFTIDFGNGRGAVFPACTYHPIEVGKINNKGEMIGLEKYIYVSKDLVESYELKEEEKTVVDENAPMVYVSVTGKYHSKSNCSGMKTYSTMTYEEAKNYGYEPCKKCY